MFSLVIAPPGFTWAKEHALAALLAPSGFEMAVLITPMSAGVGTPVKESNCAEITASDALVRGASKSKSMG